jgi:hypothetical protein
MVWVVVTAVFLFLLGRSLSEALSTTSSRPLAFLGTLLDGAAMLAFGLGVFGLLMALVLGILAESGPRLVGQSLRDVLVMSAALIGAGAVALFVGTAVRGLGARRPANLARVNRGGH